MAGDIVRHNNTPSDFEQMGVVWKYEILKYVRSKRLFATLAIVGIILALIYLVPLYFDGYNGTDSDVVLLPFSAGIMEMTPSGPDDAQFVAFIDRDTIEPDTIEVFIGGELYPSLDGANWVYLNAEIEGDTHNVLLFMVGEDVAGHDISTTYDWHVSAESFDSNFISFVSILIIICSVAFAADSLVGEFQSRTGYLIFPNAIKRETLFAGKFMASITMGMVVVGLFYIVVAVLSMISASGVDDDFLVSFGFAAGFVFAAMGIAYLISAIMKGSTGAIVFTFFLLLMILPIVDSVTMVVGAKVEGSVTFAASAIVYVLMDPYPEDSMIDVGTMEFHNYYPTPSTAAIVLVVYTLVSCLLSAIIFKRKQLAG
ncbi:MAG TPA: ABC transporter permease [Thermoplasmata archaeon]|nr:ABC transporter permease [Thermoplasmata archaeon]